MKSKSIKKLVVTILVLSMMSTVSVGTTTYTFADDGDTVSTSDTADATTEDGGEEEYQADAVDEDFVARDETELFNSMTTIAENDNFILKYNENEEDDEDLLALQNKSNGYIWWSSPINAMGDTNATNTLRQELKSMVNFTYGKPSDRTTANQRSAKNGSSTYEMIDNGIKITFKFKKVGITIPVEYTLEDNYLKVLVKTDEIVEDNPSDTDGNLLTSMTLLGSFGAVSQDDCDGYFVIPDGSGALINFNNGKTSAKSYSGKIYGSDTAMVSTTASAVTEQVYFPMYGIVREDGNGLMAVIAQGDSNASIKSSVSIQSKSSYNICNFEFTLRSTDTYYMGSDTTPLTVFEKDGMKSENLEVRYYPIADDEVDYTDIAECYRNYLMEDGGVTQKETENDSNLYIDLYGGVEKTTPVCGIPMTLKTSITSFDNAKEIISEIKSNGTDDMVVSYHNWTNAGIKNQVDNKATASNVLGGSSKFKSFTKYLSQNGISLYPVVDNDTFVSGGGYYTFKNTNIRVSGSYSRILSYDLAFGEQDSSKDTYSLLSPSVFSEIYTKLGKKYSSANLTGVSIGCMTSTLYGDYGKQSLSREDTQNIIEDSLSGLESSVGSVLGITANAYTIPYLDHITDVPLSSSNYDVFDSDIPFYQLVMHGVTPLATTPINASADSDTLLLQAIATGMNPRYDLIYEETSTLKDTEYDNLYYAYYTNWVDTASQQYQFAKNVLDSVSGSYITSYKQDGDTIYTEYDNGTKTEVNLVDKTVKVNGTVYNYSDYVVNEEGVTSNE
jgi:hypothetical protein